MVENTTPFDFQIVKVVISAERLRFVVDIARVISEINIYEHVDKPFLTGNIVFNDNDNLYNEINWLGTEKIEITIKTDEGSKDTITRKFRVLKINQAIKSNDQNETFMIDIVEEHAYLSSLKKVQKSYEGYHVEIIEKILKDNLNLELMYDKNKPFTGFKKKRVIVPNMTPFEAANWVKDGAPDAFGSPYYLYATIADEKIRYIDLETILNLNPMNPNTPYIFSQAYGGKSSEFNLIDQGYIIQTYKTANTEDMLSLVKKGYVGANWNFFDLYKGDQFEIRHDISKTFASMVGRRVFPPQQNDPVYDEDANLHSNISREMNQIATSRIYTDWETYGSYHEEESDDLYKNKVVQKSLRNFILKSPIHINVPGRNFLRKDQNMTIGNIINLRFHTNDDQDQEMIDHKRTGEYMIYAARHVFTANRYTVNLTCAKMAQEQGVEQ